MQSKHFKRFYNYLDNVSNLNEANKQSLIFYIDKMFSRLIKRLERERKMKGSVLPSNILTTEEYLSFLKKINNNPILCKIDQIKEIFAESCQIVMEELHDFKKNTD